MLFSILELNFSGSLFFLFYRNLHDVEVFFVSIGALSIILRFVDIIINCV